MNQIRCKQCRTRFPKSPWASGSSRILATTLGETGGDTATMTMGLGYLTGTAIFLSALTVLVGIQIAAKKFYPALYWSVIVASTTAGTTMADFATRSLGLATRAGH